MSVVAEGIEDADTAELLWRSGCETGQGYYYGRPMPAAEFERRFLPEGAGKDAKAVTAA
jgi:EAL domain-containing protein (putative c-di-GMP-specific phosphodiesterase class I)